MTQPSQAQLRKLAYDLINSEVWSDLLSPLIHSASGGEVSDYIPLSGLDHAFQVSNLASRRQMGNEIRDRLKRLALEHVKPKA